MVLVGLAALLLYYAIPACRGLIWLAQVRGSTMMFDASIYPRPPMAEPLQVKPSFPTYQLGKPFRMEVTSQAKPAAWIPAGLAYRIEVRVSVKDFKTLAPVEAAQKQVRWVSTSTPPPNEGWFTDTFTFMPHRPGDFLIEYELWVTDLLNRSSQNATTISEFTAQ